MIEMHAWDERLDVGDRAIDHDHHMQIALTSAFVAAVEQGRPWVARRVAEQLAEYSRAHFRSEELLMDDASEEGKRHGGEHDALIARIDALREANANGETDLALTLALDFRTALAAHMASSDQRLAELLREQR